MRLVRRHIRHAALAVLALGLVARPAPADDATGLEHPLGPTRLTMRGSTNPSHRWFSLSGRWSTAGTMFNPALTEATLHVTGGGQGEDSGRIVLNATKWYTIAKGRGFKYSDPTQSAGGVRTIVLRAGKKAGGNVKIVGGGAHWQYALGQSQTSVTVTLQIGSARWCAEFKTFTKNLPTKVQGASDEAPQTCPCEGFDSTWAAIQSSIIQRYGCTDSLCHGTPTTPGGKPQGGLDLTPDHAYADLIDVPSTTDPTITRVSPGEQETSMLWLKLAKRTLGDSAAPGIGGAGMPNNDKALTTDELEAVRLWIRAGAPEAGVVRGTDTLLSACLPAPEPIKIRPPAVPAVDEGVQLDAPPWTIPAHGEGEVCYATYYDQSATIPAEDQAPCPDYLGGSSKQCFFYNHDELTQDPNSHHSIIHIYTGSYDITDDIYTCADGPNRRQPCTATGNECGDGYHCVDTGSAFGPFKCLGGTSAGQTCDPKGPASQCPGEGAGCAGRVQSTIACIGYGPPDFGFDITGLGGNKSPAFGGSQQPFFKRVLAPGVFAMLPTKGIIVWNSHAFNLTDEPATNQQYQNLYFAPPADRLYYERGIFDSTDIFVENVPPFESREYCRTITMPKGSQVFEMSSHMHKRGVLFRVWGPGIPDTCTSRNGGVCLPESGTPILTSTDYTDPDQPEWSPPVSLDGDDPASRTYKFCALYDNGKTDPTKVKRQSTSPPTPFGKVAPGGPCDNTTVACMAGPHKAALCHGDNTVCDSAPGAGDGVCDACPLRGGVTTEDEMFILLGTYYCAPGTDCETQAPSGP